MLMTYGLRLSAFNKETTYLLKTNTQ